MSSAQLLLCGLRCRSAAAGCLLHCLPAALLQVIMTEAIQSVSCTCSIVSSMPELGTMRGAVCERKPSHAAALHGHSGLYVPAWSATRQH
jgi:hypothetical protein